MLAVALTFVGITLVMNGVLIFGKADPKTLSMMNIITAIVIVVGNFIGLARAESVMDYQNAAGGFLFGFTYAILASNMLFGLDGRAYGWYSGMVAVFAIVMGTVTIPTGLYQYVFLWYAWAILWGSGFVESACGKPLGKFTPVLLILEGIFAAFVPAILMHLGMWDTLLM